LGYAQKSSSTLKCTHSFATLYIRPRRGENEYIGEGACAGGGAEEDEIWRNSFGCSAGDDSVVLGQVRDENAEDDKAVPKSVVAWRRSQ